MKLYVADDEPGLVEVSARYARMLGWSVETAFNGRELIDLLKSETGPAVLHIDVGMPEMDGIEVIEHLAEVDLPLRVRFVTGGEPSGAIAARMIAAARSLDVGRFLMKPVALQTLKAALDEDAKWLANVLAEAAPVAARA